MNGFVKILRFEFGSRVYVYYIYIYFSKYDHLVIGLTMFMNECCVFLVARPSESSYPPPNDPNTALRSTNCRSSPHPRDES